jgi:hypothetical protein
VVTPLACSEAEALAQQLVKFNDLFKQAQQSPALLTCWWQLSTR